MEPHVCQFIPRMIIPANALRDLGESIAKKVRHLAKYSYVGQLTRDLVYASSIVHDEPSKNV